VTAWFLVNITASYRYGATLVTWDQRLGALTE